MAHSHSVSRKELVLAAMRHETLPSVPWVPFAGVHAGSLKGYNATEVLTDEDKLVESLMAVNRQYDPDGQPVVFDLQIEAEILGCELAWAEKAPPSVVTHPLAQKAEIPNILPEKSERQTAASFERDAKNENQRWRSNSFVRAGDRTLHAGFPSARNRDFHGYV